MNAKAKKKSLVVLGEAMAYNRGFMTASTAPPTDPTAVSAEGGTVADVEAGIREKWTRGDLQGAATDALRAYGPELLGLLHALTRDESLASEAFSLFSEDLWKGIAGFQWRASMRTWLYALARHACTRVLASPHLRPRRNVPLSESPLVSKLVDEVRDRTLPHLRTEVKTEVALLREALSAEDQLLLILRVDRQMPWKDVARVVLGEDADEAALNKTSALLRKRFQLLKDELREKAKARGLLDPT